jgi:hypothetical protein
MVDLNYTSLPVPNVVQEITDMLDSPEPPHTEILSNTTNVRESLPFHASQLSTALDEGKPKRRRTQSEETPTKRPKMMVAGSSNEQSDVDVEMEEVTIVKRRGCRRTAFRMLGLASNGYPTGPYHILCESYSFSLYNSLINISSIVSQYSAVICFLTYVGRIQMPFKSS